MSIESDAASQVASIYTKGIEEAANVAVKIGGEVFEISKQLLEVLLVKGVWENLIHQDGKMSGKVTLHNILRKASDKGQPLHVLDIKDKDEFQKVSKELSNSGVLFAKAKGDSFNIIFTEDSAPLVNRTIENLGLTSVGKEISSDVTAGKAEKDTVSIDEITLEDDDLHIVNSVSDYTNDVNGKVNLRKDNDNEKSVDDTEYTAQQSIDLSESQEYDDPDKFAKDMQKKQHGKDRPLTKDGEAAAPSKKKSAAEKSSAASKQSIHEKLADKKADRAIKAAADKAKGTAEKAVDSIKEVRGR